MQITIKRLEIASSLRSLQLPGDDGCCPAVFTPVMVRPSTDGTSCLPQDSMSGRKMASWIPLPLRRTATWPRSYRLAAAIDPNHGSRSKSPKRPEEERWLPSAPNGYANKKDAALTLQRQSRGAPAASWVSTHQRTYTIQAHRKRWFTCRNKEQID
jgi:hypothetical protein